MLIDATQEGPVSWIPSYEAAAALVQMIHSEEPVLHLASAHPVPLHTFMKPFSEALDVPLVPYPIWLKAMEDNFKDARYSEVELVEHNPGLRLLSFYRNAKFDGKGEPPGVVQLDTSKARKVATSLNQVKLGAEWVDKWIQAWRRTGFLPQSDNARRFEGKYAGKL